MRSSIALAALFVSSSSVVACSPAASPNPSPGPGTGDCTPSATLAPGASSVPLSHRAYVVSRDSGDVTVIDLDHLAILGNLETCGDGNHMAELNADFSKIYVDSPATRQSIVVDAATLQVKTRIQLAAEPTHLTLSKDGKLLAIVNEGDDSVSFVDPARDVEVKRVSGFYEPHFVRFAPDGRYAYVANLGAYHVTRVDLQTLSIDAEIPLDGFDVPPKTPRIYDESGFADAQIDHDGILYAAHARTGRVLVYDTKSRTKLPELHAGAQPWIVYAEHPFAEVARHLVPNLGDQTVSMIARDPLAIAATVAGADRETYGVNYSSVVPNRAFVMNRRKNEVAVLDVESGARVATIPVGGTTETASTTADGKYIVAAVSSANRVVVIDAATSTVVKTFDDVGKYPWSVTIPMGQNYCH